MEPGHPGQYRKSRPQLAGSARLRRGHVIGKRLASYLWMAAAVVALFAAQFLITTEVSSMNSSEASKEIPAMDGEAPEKVRTATFAMG
jgi:hypothetical protein